jgi:uncharacterized membrane protein
MKIDWRTELPCWLLLAGMFFMAAISWSSAPAQIPVHWGLEFQPDRYGGKFEGLLFLPLMGLGLYIFLLFLAPRIDPGRANYPRFASTSAVLRIALLAFMAGIYALVHLWIRGIEWSFGVLLPIMLGVLFIVLGNLMGKVRPNWFIGIRTPWTLTSKVAWSRTHRLGGWLFIVCGFLWLASALVHRAWAAVVPLVVLLAGSLALSVYSFFLWRSDPDKVPPAGTEPT